MPGTYNYAFQCLLPRHLPTSVEGREGYIRYTICVGLDIPMGFDKTFEVPFTVIRAINLNAIPTLRVISESIFFSSETHFFLFLFRVQFSGASCCRKEYIFFVLLFTVLFLVEYIKNCGSNAGRRIYSWPNYQLRG